MLGPFMPWITLGMLSASGMDKTGSEAVVLVFLGLIAALMGASGLKGKPVSRGVTVVGMVAGLLVVYYGTQIFESVSSAPAGFSPSPGIGIYVTGFGAIIAVAAPFLGSKRQEVSGGSVTGDTTPCPKCKKPMPLSAGSCAECGYGSAQGA